MQACVLLEAWLPAQDISSAVPFEGMPKGSLSAAPSSRASKTIWTALQIQSLWPPPQHKGTVPWPVQR